MIHYTGFTKSFGSVIAVDDLDLTVRRGETLALIGPNGSGKTTTLKALVGLVRPTKGQVTVAGIDAPTGGARARSQVGYLPQRLSFPDGMTARTVLLLYARLRNAPADEADELLARVGLADVAGRVVDGLSGGMRQRLGLAAALLGQPAALVLDEPTASLDPSGALLVRDVVHGIRQEGTTVLLSSHDLAEVASLADRIAVFCHGRIRALGPLGELETIAGRRGLEEVYRYFAGATPLRRVA